MGMVSNLAAKYWFVCGIAVSLLWFAAARQSLSNRRADAAIGWQAIAVIIALIVCGRSAAEREWLGLVAGIVAVYFEVRSIRRSTLNNQRQ
jgi:hypothetical protein